MGKSSGKTKGASGQIYSRGNTAVRWILSIFLICYTAITFFVFCVTIMNSFKAQSDLSTSIFGWPKQFTLSNYVMVIQKNGFFQSFANSLIVTAGGTTLCIFLAALTAYGISRYEFRGKGFLTAYFLIGMMVPIQVAILPLFLMLSKVHLINSRIGLALVYGAGISFPMYVFSKFFRTIPKALEESAKLDGASDFRIFWSIMLPICKPVILTMCLITSIGFWNDFYVPMVLLSRKAKQTLMLSIYQYISQFVRKMNIAFAAVVLTLIPIIMIYCVFNKQMVEGITGGSVKG